MPDEPTTPTTPDTEPAPDTDDGDEEREPVTHSLKGSMTIELDPKDANG